MSVSKGIRALTEQYCKYCKSPYKMTASGHALHLRAHLNNLKKTMAQPKTKAAKPQPTPATQPTPQPTPVAATATPAQTLTLNPLACPECAEAGIERIFTSKIGRGHHRSRAHGYKGPNFEYYQRQKTGIVKHNSRGIERHANGNSNGKSSASTIGGHEIATVYAAGYVKSRIDQFAESGNLPASVLTQGVCELLLDSTGGQALRPEMRVPNMRRQTS